MTTITRGQLLAAADHHRIDRHEALKLVSTLGIAITDPEPPEAMLKLADEGYRAWDGRCIAWRNSFTTGYLAALQHVEKEVRSSPHKYTDPKTGDVYTYQATLLAAIGSTP